MDSSKPQLGVCIVGTGSISAHHMNGWREESRARVVAVCDVRDDVAEAYAEKHGVVRWFTDYRDALSWDEVDAVSVCTPAGVHPEVVCFAAQQQKHVLCEKPMALTVADCERMIASAEENGVKLFVGHMERYLRLTAKMRDLMREQAIGRPVLAVSCGGGSNLRPDFHSRSGNGGPVVDGCVHAFDTWRVIFEAPAVRVMARGHIFGSYREELEQVDDLAYDAVGAVIEYGSGDVCTLVNTNALPPAVGREHRSSMQEYLGPMGKIVGHVRSGITVIRSDGSTESFESEGTGPCFPREVRAFVDCILNDTEPEITGHDGKLSVGVALGVLESVQTGEAVELV